MDEGPLGQVDTPPALATAICRWAIRPAPDGSVPRVLDPAVGPGVFATAAADRLDGLGAETPLDAIVAVDVDADALDETRNAVADRAGTLTAIEDSFLALAPDESGRAAGSTPTTVGRFDAVVGNPPYLRQEAIDTAHYRAHLDAYGPPDRTPYRDGPVAIDGRCDAYAYFLTHAAQFLREGGRLGFVVPTKWLESRYGESLQRFLLDHYRVEAVVGFDERAFPDVLVDAAILCCVRRADDAARRDATTRFVRIDDPLSADALVDAADAGVTVPDGNRTATLERGSHRVVALRQADLADGGPGKLSPHLRAPAALVALLEHPGLVPLGDLATVHRGVTTGANAFFLLDADRTRGIDERFLRPAVRSLREVDGRVVRAPPDRYLFDVHEYVASVGSRTDGGDADLATRVTQAMAADGHDGALAHVARGERRGIDERRTCATRPVWFDLGPLSAPAVLHPKFFDERVVAIHNPDRLVPTNAVDCVSLDADVPEAAVLAALNSTVHAAALECWGRAEGGGALQLMTYEVETVPVLDVRALGDDARATIVAAYRSLVAGDPGARTTLDRAVLEALGADLSVDRLRRLRERMVARRVDRTSGVLVEDGG